MAVKSVFACSFFSRSLQVVKPTPENCSEARCKLVPVGGGLRLNFASSLPRKLPSTGDKDEFLAERWVWANTINDPMLSLSYEYDILSLGLLTYQVRSINVSLEEQPSGCLASLNASCHDKVVGRALLNETKQSSGEPLHETDVVCVAIIEDAPNFYSNFFEGNVKYHCCGRSKGESAKDLQFIVNVLLTAVVGSRPLMEF
ncbi:hypothetical protein OS493_037870 [Desmophyllum pertusum]|uniref:Uncharacterized protein n=1 Tax=Desmophyllum pertusum TaxID=174260 RepID=A0A9W9Z6V2_9CNID|nr:hypothetical protein OS493_037870 [Desmophyllum pertusum]